jgi:AcrR family transcriptional regulator
MELPVVQPSARPARADAARNRERILCAARRLYEARGPEGVSMDDVACEAGVGKGTLYRRFGDRGGLARALLEDAEIPFQDRLIHGDPPLGPGAPAAERLHAFGDGMFEQLERLAPLMLDAERHEPGARFKQGPYGVYRTHLTILLRDALGDDVPHEYLADCLLAPLSAEVFLHHRRGRGLPLDEIRGGWHQLAGGLLRCSG